MAVRSVKRRARKRIVTLQQRQPQNRYQAIFDPSRRSWSRVLYLFIYALYMYIIFTIYNSIISFCKVPNMQPSHLKFLSILMLLAALTLPLLLPQNPARAAELLMLEQPGCAWCVRWHKEIGEAYPNTEQGKRAPLRRIDIHKKWPDDLENIRIERTTPTFILIDDNKEIARLRGYPGDHFFWPLLDEMLSQLPNR